MKHTQGPWVAYTMNKATATIRATTNNDTIATVYRTIGSPTLMDRAGEGDANARLIAAAPDLYEALRSLCDDLLTPASEWTDRKDRARRLIQAIGGETL